MDGLREMIPDLKYRGLMLKLSRQITAQDMAEFKYMLTSLIPDGKKETLDTAIELFRFLEQQLFVGPNNLSKLEELFRLMDKPALCEMVTKYICGRDHRAVETFAESAVRMCRRLVHWFVIQVRRH
jgi:hypothetical protein